jgi:hypothetical protein
MRTALGQAAGEARSSRREGAAFRSALGIDVLPQRDEIISNEHVDRLRDELGV